MKFTSLLALGASIVPILAGAQGAARPDSASSDTGYVVYHDSPISLPLLLGIRTPVYDRIDGLALPWGPKLSLGEDMFDADAVINYRSNLGKLDPSFRARLAPMRDASLQVVAERGTFTNDGWIRDGLLNSFVAFGMGTDTRNYYRADKLVAKGNLILHPAAGEVEASLGAQHEFAWSTGTVGRPPHAPWSVFGRSSKEKMLRSNPSVLRGTISSAIGGLAFQLEQDKVKAAGSISLESAFDTPASGNFTQATLELKSTFPALLDHTFDFHGHAVMTGGATAPPQRFSYLGGSSTLPTMKLLEQGGDRLLFVDGRYSIPLHMLLLPVLGNPVFGLRYAAGSAGIGKLPKFTQNVGVFAGVRFAQIDYLYDPAARKSAFSFGLVLPQ